MAAISAAACSGVPAVRSCSLNGAAGGRATGISAFGIIRGRWRSHSSARRVRLAITRQPTGSNTSP
jgi:hypothetical protein